ncbi:beta-galactosidase [Lacrimispora indolis]|uniref:beta-galactosidase n=1 Tax=Lacrimispora indolis TaxID=69825 RepID=UPI00045E8ADC|nr:beta-galactosidase [Lacrimispora indolis]
MEELYLDLGALPVRRGAGRMEPELNPGELVVSPDQCGFVEMDLMSEDDVRIWSRYSYLVLELKAGMDAMACVDLCFFKGEGEKPDNVLSYQMIPTQDVTLLVDFSELKSVRYFLKTMPGMLKGHCTGLPAELSEMKRVTVLVHPGYSREFSGIRLKAAYLTDTVPDIRVEGPFMVDEFGQWIQKDWDTKTHSEEELISYLKYSYERAKAESDYPEGFSRYGGCKAVVFEKTGYFRLTHAHDRWWLVDPDGYGFFSNGVCYGSRMGVFGFVDGMEQMYSWLPKEDDPVYREAWTNAGEIAEYVKRNGKESGKNRKMFNFARANMIRAFGPDKWWEAWHTINTARLKRWGFNTIGVGVNNYFDERVMEYLEKANIPFVWTLKEFPQTKEKIFRDFPDVYSEEYRSEAEAFARRQMAPFADNPYMIGYFINNEPEWRFQEVNLAERTFSHPQCLESKKKLVELLKEKYGTIEALNASWDVKMSAFEDLYVPREALDQWSDGAGEDFRFLHDTLVEMYESVVAEELKKRDSNHLDLGMRYSKADIRIMGGCRQHDVFSFNCYEEEPESRLKLCSQKEDVPMLIGEWHIGGGDKGNLSHGLLASPNQEERGKALEYYLQRAMSHKNCVGAHYFEMNDQPLLGRFDGECMEHGLIDICNRQFEPLVSHLEHTGHHMYEYVRGIKTPTKVRGIMERNE